MDEKLWRKSYGPGVPRQVEYEKLTISQALTRTAGRFPNRVALNYMGAKITYRELEALVNRFARALTDLGAKPGDKIAICLPNLAQTVIANMAIFRIGATAVQNNPLYTERELKHQLADSDSTMIITLSLLVPRVANYLSTPDRRWLPEFDHFSSPSLTCSEGVASCQTVCSTMPYSFNAAARRRPRSLAWLSGPDALRWR